MHHLNIAKLSTIPEAVFWYRVSSNNITPLRHSKAPGVVNRSSLRARLFASTFSTLMLAKRLPIVPVDSSAARIPFPGVPM